jgi:hypothetical protein
MDLGDYILALLATAVVIYIVGRLLIRHFFAARRRHVRETMTDLIRGETPS